MTMIWHMVPEILSMMERFLCHFGLFFAFLPFNNPKKQNFHKVKKRPGDIIILHKCTKNHDHMLYCSWDMACERCNCYFSFWAIFCPFTPLTTQKIKISKKWKKKHLEIFFFFTHVYQKLWLDDVQFWRYGAWQMDEKSHTYRWVPKIKIPNTLF